MISRLKSLELQGYKTFANRTAFEFPGAVTAIVGPNGSGKSNITDALRWVLGEQSYSLLRGKKTEDMIFAGSDRRTRSGMATVTVILDNSDNWLPIDYSEVAIARRAYRDGSNEYLLNGQRVRLRDVSELLAESGLAERTYTIIGQGLVDAALALRAEDRRRLFEEAAGIGLHRTRRQEAVRRLDDTQRNLERVDDILHELRPRLRSLERQASRAQEYEHAISDLRALLREWYGYHWHRAQEELSEARALAGDQNESLEITRKREQELESEINELREKRSGIREQLNEFHRQSAGLHTERESTSRDLAVSEERARNLQDQEITFRGDLAQSLEEVSIIEERNRFALDEVQKLVGELEEAEERDDSVRTAFEVRQKERGELEAGLAGNRQLLIELSTNRAQIISRRAEYMVQVDSLTKSMRKIEESNQQSIADQNKIEFKGKEISRDLAVAVSKQSKTETVLGNLQEEISIKSVKLQDLSKKLSASEAEFAKLNAQSDVLMQAERIFVGYSEGAKSLLEAVKDFQIAGSRGVLGTSLEVPKQYEIAVGAALGDYVDALVLESGAEINKALRILEEKAEKAAIIPLDGLHPGNTLANFSVEEGVEGRADEFVDVADDLKPAIKILLGNTLVVKDRKSAEKILKSIRRNPHIEGIASVKIVTMLGEIFHATGPIKTSSSSTPVTLSRPREGRELQKKINSIEDVVKHIQSELTQIERDIFTLKGEEERLHQQLQIQAKIHEELAAAHRQELMVLEQATREYRWRQEQMESFAADIKNLQDKIISSTEELGQSELQIQHVQEQVDQQLERLHDLPIENLQTDLAHWSTRVEILKQALAESRKRHAERSQSLETALGKAETINNSIVTLQDYRIELSEQINILKQATVEIGEKLETTRHLIAPADAALEEIELILSDLLRLESKERLQTSQAEQNFTQARITQVRKQEALDSLRRQIEVDFGLVAFEYHEDVSGPTPLPLEGFVEDLPIRENLSPELEETLKQQRALLRRIGPINPEAQIEYQDVAERYEFLSSQVHDLQEASEDVQRVIAELDEIMQREFCKTFEAVAEEFHQIFGRLFGGGSARLILTDPNDLTNTGIDIEARLPGRREQGLSLLSGGERSLTAVALVFSLLRVSPTPFCVLDEVDAMLDEANVGRFRELLRELSKTTQFIMITHNRATVQVADIIYGVTMGRDSTSQILSLKIDDLEQVIN